MNRIGPMLCASGRLGLNLAERLVVGVDPRTFGQIARPGGQRVHSNHPAFIFGHLCLYPPRIMRWFNLPTGDTDVPANYDALFKAGVECRDDVDGSVYPPMRELTEKFFTGYRAVMTAIEACPDDAVFFQVNPVEGRSRELFPTLGAAVGFYLGGHVQLHLGQMSAWRRMMGLGSAL